MLGKTRDGCVSDHGHVVGLCQALVRSIHMVYFLLVMVLDETASGREVKMKTIIRVADIRGKCPVYRLGNKITLQIGYILDPKETDIVCLHSMASILPYYIALSKGVKAKDLGLSRANSQEAYVQCLDPCEITGGGTVRFEISVVTE